MVMLHGLHRLSKKFAWKITVGHLNHQLRGRSSDADQRLVKCSARNLGAEVVVERADVRRLAAERKVSIEMAAREVRHEFLARTARQRRIRFVVLAHHADDQVELFFLRIFRGAGPDGLSGMKPLAASPADPGIKLARPMLGLSREAIRAFAEGNKIAFREDASNEAVDVLRNRIRYKLLPVLESEYQPEVRAIVGRVMDILRTESEFLDQLARTERERRTTFDALHPALQRRILKAELIKAGVPIDYGQIERLRRAEGKASAVAPGKIARRDARGTVFLDVGEWPKFSIKSAEVELSGKPKSTDFEGVHLSWRLVNAARRLRIPTAPGMERFDADEVGERIILRHWQEGDTFQPIGMPQAVKLQDLFTNLKVPRVERHQRVVAVAADGKIFWVEGLRIAEPFKLRKKTRRVLEWKWHRA